MENNLVVTYTWGTGVHTGFVQNNANEIKEILAETGEKLANLAKTPIGDASFRDFNGKTVDIPIRTTA